jgi:hypothetical protein
VREFAQENLPCRQVVAIARPALTDFCDPLNELVAKKIIESPKQANVILADYGTAL